MIAIGVRSSKRLPKPRPLKNPTQVAALPPTADPFQVTDKAVATKPPTFPPSTRRHCRAQQKDPEPLEVQVSPLPLQPAFPIAQVTATHSSES
jgi:hypothetical protein